MLNTAFAGNSTDVTVYVRGFTASTGLPYTAGAWNTSGIAASYIREGGSSTSITLATQTANGAHSDGGFVHVAGGVYRLDLPDAAVATGADFVMVQVSGIADVTFTAAQVDITGSNPRTADLTATDIANAVVEAEIDALETYNRSSNTAATITGPINGATTLTITTDASYQPIKSIA